MLFWKLWFSRNELLFLFIISLDCFFFFFLVTRDFHLDKIDNYYFLADLLTIGIVLEIALLYVVDLFFSNLLER